MVLVLCLGDLHVPYRTSDMPQQFKDILLPGKVQQILCTGDVCTKEMYDYLKTICTNIHVVKGQFDEDHAYPETKVRRERESERERERVERGSPRQPAALALTPARSALSFRNPNKRTPRLASPPSLPQVVKIGDLKFGLVHGHTVIPWGDIASLGMVQRQLDVDVLISGHTQEFRTYAYEDKLLVNPGSATGAYSSKESSTTPSFCLFDVDGSKATIYMYKLVGGEVKKEKMIFGSKR